MQLVNVRDDASQASAPATVANKQAHRRGNADYNLKAV